jgi:hypothetical protein
VQHGIRGLFGRNDTESGPRKEFAHYGLRHTLLDTILVRPIFKSCDINYFKSRRQP